MNYYLKLTKKIAKFLMLSAPSYPPKHIFRARNTIESDTTTSYLKFNEESDETSGAFEGYFPVQIDSYFKEKIVLDLGCSDGGRIIKWMDKYSYQFATGIDIISSYLHGAKIFAEEVGTENRISFVTGAAEILPISDYSFDTIISFDSMEHVADPYKVLNEAYRVLRSGGYFLVVFPPYYHPYGAHLGRVTNFPWIHVLPVDAIEKAYNSIVQSRGEKHRFYLRGLKKPWEKIHGLNGLSISRWQRLVRNSPFENIIWYRLPLFYQGDFIRKHKGFKCFKPFSWLASHTPIFQEAFTHRMVCILRKPNRIVNE